MLIQIGKIIGTKGIKGEMKLHSHIELEPLKGIVITEKGLKKSLYRVESINATQKGFLLKLEEVNSIEEAQKFIGSSIFIAKKDIRKVFKEYIAPELIKMPIYHGGVEIGAVEAISSNGHNHFIMFKYKEREIVIPLIEQLIRVEEERVIFNERERIESFES